MTPAPSAAGASGPPALELTGVTVWEWDGRRRVPILHDIAWTVGAGEQWAVLGPNGAGKTTLLAVAAGARYPSRGEVRVLGERLGRVDLRSLRERIGQVDARTEERFAPRRTALEVVLSGATGTIQLLPERLTGADRDRAARLLSRFGCAARADHAFGACSQGERRRVLLARALMRHPPLLLLDEPADGLDLPSREALLAAVVSLADPPDIAAAPPAVVTVTHHLEELPASTTHALLLRDGRVAAAGPAAQVLRDAALTACFDVPVSVRRDDGRWTARATPSW